jgi:hypothetical protein
MGFPALSRFYNCQEIVLTAGQERIVTYEFEPEQIIIVPKLNSVITDSIEITPVGAQGGGRIQLRGTGPIIVPGLSKQLLLKNNDLVSRTLIVTAQRGYMPASIVMPVTSVVPTSVGLLSQLISTYANIGSASPIHPHVQDGWILVAITGFDGVAQWTATAVTAAGKTGVLIRDSGPNGGTRAQVWAIQDVPAGQQSVSITLSIASVDFVCITTFSLDPAVGMGNSGLLNWNVDAAQNVSLVNLEDRSASLWFVSAQNVDVLETSGAEAVFNQLVGGTTRSKCWRREGQGTVSWVLDGQGVGQHASVGVELRLSS